MSVASVGGQAARLRGLAKLSDRCPRPLREQPPFFARAKKAQKITEYRDTAPLNFAVTWLTFVQDKWKSLRIEKGT